jgi:hypothetical protein
LVLLFLNETVAEMIIKYLYLENSDVVVMMMSKVLGEQMSAKWNGMQISKTKRGILINRKFRSSVQPSAQND